MFPLSLPPPALGPSVTPSIWAVLVVIHMHAMPTHPLDSPQIPTVYLLSDQSRMYVPRLNHILELNVKVPFFLLAE